MNRLFVSMLTVLSVVIGASYVSKPDVVNATWPELRQVSDPARDQGLNLGFADVSGAFLGDVTLVIADQSGLEVVNTIVDGPWFYAPLPAGTYDVKAIFDDQLKHIKDLHLAKDKVTMMVMYWDLNVPATQMMASEQSSAKSCLNSLGDSIFI
jgi:hypothetical protein